MAKGGQIHVVVDEKQKERWQEEVEDSKRYETLSELIRISVEKELSGESGGATEPPALSSDVQELASDVEQIRKDVAFLKEQHRDEVDISELAQEVFQTLKPLPSGTTGEGASVDSQQYAASLVVQEHGPQTISAIAGEVGSDPARVDDAIGYLEEQFMPVVEVTLGENTVEDHPDLTLENQWLDKRHYFRED